MTGPPECRFQSGDPGRLPFGPDEALLPVVTSLPPGEWWRKDVDIGTWLRSLRLSQYEQAFRDNDIDADILPELTAEDLIGLGVTSIGHRRKLLRAIAVLRSDGLARGATVEPQPAALLSAEPARRGAERRQLTVVFVDLVGSTALSARFDPEDMSKLLRAYQNAVTGGVARFEGHVAKLMGDGMLAYFGWPRA